MQVLEKILEEIEENKHIVEIFGRGVYFVPLEATKQIIRKHMNDGWIPVEDRLPKEKVNPVTTDYYEYQVTAKFGNVKDVRRYKYGNGHWWHGPGIVDEYVIAWRENPEPYRSERNGDSNDA